MMFGKVSAALDINLARKHYMNAAVFGQMITGPDDCRQAEQFPIPADMQEWLYTPGEYDYGRLDQHLLRIVVSSEFAEHMDPTGPGDRYRDTPSEQYLRYMGSLH
jgi:hypothetical protein